MVSEAEHHFKSAVIEPLEILSNKCNLRISFSKKNVSFATKRFAKILQFTVTTSVRLFLIQQLWKFAPKFGMVENGQICQSAIFVSGVEINIPSRRILIRPSAIEMARQFNVINSWILLLRYPILIDWEPFYQHLFGAETLAWISHD